MIDEKLKKFLLKEHGEYNFKKLVEYLESRTFDIKLNYLVRATGFTTIDSIYFDLDNLKKHNSKMIFYIILHEIGHYKRIQKYGSDWVIEMLSISNFDDYFKGIVDEEIFADRFSCYMFYKMNKIIYPWNETQQLNLTSRQEKYKPLANMLFGKINNNKQKYYDFVNQIIT
jgi:hypothetical protein